jgi:hypothetical protein
MRGQLLGSRTLDHLKDNLREKYSKIPNKHASKDQNFQPAAQTFLYCTLLV